MWILGRAALLVSLVAASDLDYNELWEDFKNTFHKEYDVSLTANSTNEEQRRFEVFKENINFINEVNSKRLTYTLGINQFTDMTSKEFAHQYAGLKEPDNMWGDAPYLGRHVYSGKPLPASVDWTTQGAVTPVADQGKCGSCWTFSTTGALEGAWKIATGSLVPLSKQQFLDCDKDDNACNGGSLRRAYPFAQQNAICTEDSYEYKSGTTGQPGKCMASGCRVGLPLGDITGWKSVGNGKSTDEQMLMDAVAMNPVSTTIAFSEKIFKSYHSGVLTASSCDSPAFPSALNHAILVVGYGTEDNTKYWLIKNSFGSTWGEKGYMKLLRGVPNPGECGILSGPPLYPVVHKKSHPISFV